MGWGWEEGVVEGWVEEGWEVVAAWAVTRWGWEEEGPARRGTSAAGITTSARIECSVVMRVLKVQQPCFYDRRQCLDEL